MWDYDTWVHTLQSFVTYFIRNFEASPLRDQSSWRLYKYNPINKWIYFQNPARVWSLHLQVFIYCSGCPHDCSWIKWIRLIFREDIWYFNLSRPSFWHQRSSNLQKRHINLLSDRRRRGSNSSGCKEWGSGFKLTPSRVVN